jgi:enamine deaminase RidA (YjgF/YER057c/UK114 family)
MTHEVIRTSRLDYLYDAYNFVPAVRVGDLLLCSGHIGRTPDGVLPEDYQSQIDNVFANISDTLQVAGASWADVADMNSYHVGVLEQLAYFTKVRAQYVAEPYSTWTGVGVVELGVKGALVEVQVRAHVAR